MARPTKELTAAEIEKAMPGEKPKYLFDGKGLFLLVTPTGGKWWRFKYRFDNKEKLLSFGTYPETSLKQAREQREEARKLLSGGVDPSVNRKAMKSAKDSKQDNSTEVTVELHQNQKNELPENSVNKAKKKLNPKLEKPVITGAHLVEAQVPATSPSDNPMPKNNIEGIEQVTVDAPILESSILATELSASPVPENNVFQPIPVKRSYRKMGVGVLIAAVVLLCILTGSWFYQMQKSEETFLAQTAHEEDIRSLVYDWLASWKAGLMNTYRGFYAPDFQAKGMNLDAWVSHKANVFRKSKNINITIDDLQISVNGNNAKAVFIQHYSSSVTKDSGKKTLELRKINNEWKIYREFM